MRVIVSVVLLSLAVSVGATDANAWYCSAVSKNGASGWGFNFFQVAAEKSALAECKSNSKGQKCYIEYCW